MRTEKDTALRFIALFEAIKGMAAIVASLGLLSLAHHDVRAMANALIGHFHWDPDGHYPRMLLDDADLIAHGKLQQTLLLAWAYAALRFTEGYGLWRDRAWAEWLAALSGTIYLPIEISHLVQHASAINAAVLLGNLGVVATMVLRLWQRRKQDGKPGA